MSPHLGQGHDPAHQADADEHQRQGDEEPNTHTLTVDDQSQQRENDDLDVDEHGRNAGTHEVDRRRPRNVVDAQRNSGRNRPEDARSRKTAVTPTFKKRQRDECNDGDRAPQHGGRRRIHARELD
ncbi:MAG: hypothetical protein L0H22_00450 [Brevibacterium aurantiacum]|nr:hypothetical protein [Brevibacterium aurantiacum]